MDEVRKTIDMSYDVVNFFEFLEYEVTCFDKDANSGSLFAHYVNMFLKFKHE